MKIAHLSDLHVTEGPRLLDQAETLTSIIDDALEASPDLWLIAGDLFGRTVPHRSTPAERNVLYPAVVRMAKQAPVVVVYGNHDHDPDLDALAHLDGDWPIRVVKRADVLQVPTVAGLAHVYALPYPSKKWLLAGDGPPRSLAEAQAAVQERLGQLLQVWAVKIRARRATHPDEPHLLLAHLQVAGSAVSGGEVLAGQEIELTRHQLDGLPIDYGALGHLHLRQEPAQRCWYAGSPWRNDYGEEDEKGWHLVTVAPDTFSLLAETGPLPTATSAAYVHVGGERMACAVQRRASACREFVTLDYRWAADHEEGTPRWITRPDEMEFARIRRTRAEVRMRLVVPEQWVGGCPWDVELARVLDAGAVRVQQEKKIEPTLRVRAPQVAAARTDAEKMTAYWSTLATEFDPNEQAAALECLDELLTHEDEEVQANTRAALTGDSA